jgi:D-alanyl-D-alanine carboxypeptidase/D-alanyl-D-alanine-endopeptidase (penicillin-binding protein 4)
MRVEVEPSDPPLGEADMRYSRLLALPLALLLAWGGATALAASPQRAEAIDPAAARLAWQRSLASRLDGVLASREFKRARVAAFVVRADDGEVLYERSPDRALTPASNVKILTAIAALDAFGPNHSFETRVHVEAPPDAEGAVEDLFVRGGGDPAMNNEDWWRLAAQLRGQGLRRVRGDLVLDDAVFDRARWHPAWGRTSSRAYHAPVGALTANYGAFSVTVSSGPEVGSPVAAQVDPPVPYLRLDNRAQTVNRRARRTVVVDRRAGGEDEIVTVTGVVRLGDPPKTYYRSVLDPTRYAGAVLRMQLAALGIAVDGRTRIGSPPEGAQRLLVFHGRPMSEIVRLFMKYSNNAVAESLVKALGAQASGGVGSWSNGLEALRARLEGLGLDASDFSLVDGSGLSYQDKVAPRALVKALLTARNSFRIAPEFMAALPIAAVDGTLEKRGDGAEREVRAKTGLLNRVTALSGYAHMGDGEVAVFSILINGYRVGDEEAMQALDRFAAELVRRGESE